jgi:membrane-associated phospholipid phosphatase
MAVRQSTGISGGPAAAAWRSPAVIAGLAVIALMTVTVDGPASALARSIDGDLKWWVDLFAKTGDSFYTLVPSAILAALFGGLSLSSRGTPRGRVYAWLAAAAGFFFVSIAFSGILTNVVKIILGRARPDAAVSLYWPEFHPFAPRGAYHAFPSGHANTLFAIAMALGCFVPRARPYLLALALPLALCRVLQFKHFLSDTAGGAGLAIITTLWLRHWFARRGIVFNYASDGRIRLAAPGRLLRRRCRWRSRGK